MKDKDFDDIGKRLYDLEADPPKNGWKKIAPAINASSGKVVWLRKHWWKPLILLLPLSVYLLYSVKQGDSVANHPSKAMSKEKTSESSTSVKEDTKHRDSKSSTQQPNSSVSSLIETTTSTGAKNESTEYNAKDRQTSISVANTALADKIVNDLSEKSIAEQVEPAAQVNQHGGMQQTQVNVTSGEKASNDELPSSNDGTRGESNQNEISLPSTNRSAAIISSPSRDTTNAQEAITLLQGKDIEADSARITVDADNESSEKITGKWRITLTFAPQYVSKVVRPVASDEILMTGVDRSGNKHKVGLSFAAGAGLSVTENLYLDAQLSYAEAEQSILFSYATGNVDTLIAIQRPDQSVVITPVYETAHREISSKYGFAGVRLGATHYFWSTARRRFSLTAMAGAHRMVSADVKEKRNGNWVPLKNNDLNKNNYTVMFSAGYNINLARGWEFMISPAFTYYLRKVKNRDLPFDLDQQSWGVNFMLSKALGGK